MRSLRSRSVGTKLTETEYATLQALAGEQRLGEWVRQVLLASVAPDRFQHIVLAEVIALRTILLNLHFAVASGETLTAEAMQRLIYRADQDKIRKAQEHLTSAVFV